MSEYIIKPAIGGAIGVGIPIAVEYAAKGARLGATKEEPLKGIKYSAVTGLAIGAIGLGGAAYGYYTRRLSDADTAALASMGAASLTTGVAIAVLDELRKRKLYEFSKTRGYVPRSVDISGLEQQSESLERVEEVYEEMIHEV